MDKEINFDDIEAKAKEIDSAFFIPGIPKETKKGDNKYKNFVEKNIPQRKKSILGLDIYKYSQYEDGRQELIPFIFDIIFNGALHYSKYQSLLERTAKEKQFIPTGDGGFIVFPTPLHSLLFNCHFYTALHMFNSCHFYPELSRFIGGLTVRSSITYDSVFNYEKNWYGKAIIKNARILSKDKLNRLLIDKETFDYFLSKFNGVESLSICKEENIKEALKNEEGIDPKKIKFDNSVFKNIHVQKLEDTVAKETKLSIYNVEIQYVSSISTDKEQKTSFVLTIGNSNVMSI
jgi:hypothetical protein